jgi:hypothetical protein
METSARVAREIVETEIKYVENLAILEKTFHIRLLKCIEVGRPVSSGSFGLHRSSENFVLESIGVTQEK